MIVPATNLYLYIGNFPAMFDYQRLIWIHLYRSKPRTFHCKKRIHQAILWRFGANKYGYCWDMNRLEACAKYATSNWNFTLYILHCLDYARVQSNMWCKRMDSSKASSKPLTSICNKALGHNAQEWLAWSRLMKRGTCERNDIVSSYFLFSSCRKNHEAHWLIGECLRLQNFQGVIDTPGTWNGECECQKLNAWEMPCKFEVQPFDQHEALQT